MTHDVGGENILAVIPIPVEFHVEVVVADPDLRSRAEIPLALDALSIDDYAVGRAKVLNKATGVPHKELCVLAGDIAAWENDVVAVDAANEI